jgi:DNA-binding transcriptional ArsR family regulator
MQEQLDAIFSALSDPTRREILRKVALSTSTRLRHGLTVSEIARPFQMSMPAISKHLNVLEQAQLIIREREGRHIRVRLLPATFLQAMQYIAQYRQYWDTELGSMDRFMPKVQKKRRKHRK